MSAVLSEITARHHAHTGAVSSPSDFTLSDGQQVPPEIVLSSPDWSLYSIDAEKGIAMFVELPPGTDLATAAFVYMTQFELAVRAVVMPLDLLGPLSQQVELPENFGILFSTGRCGSTLASRILAQIPDVWSISEPDVLQNLAFARFHIPQEQMVPLLQAVTRLLFRPPAGRKVRSFVIKPRAESVVQAPEFAQALPESRNVFMYRDAEGFVNSLHKFVQKLIGQEAALAPDGWLIGWPFSSINAPFDLLDDYFPEDRDTVDHVSVMTMGWVIRMDAYLDALENGIQMQPLHYQDLNTNRSEETGRLLRAFGISPSHIDLAMKAFETDSQAGTGGDRDLPSIPLTKAQRARVQELLVRWERPDYRAGRLPVGK